MQSTPDSMLGIVVLLAIVWLIVMIIYLAREEARKEVEAQLAKDDPES